MRQWEEPNTRPWYVLVIGEKPELDVEQRITTALSQGELATVPKEALDRLMDRRREQQQYGSWVEGHYTEQGQTQTNTQVLTLATGRQKRLLHSNLFNAQKSLL